MSMSRQAEFNTQGLIVASLPNIRRLRAYIEGIDFEKMGRQRDEASFRRSVLHAQKQFNSLHLHHYIYSALQETLVCITKSSSLMISGVAFLRVVRPSGYCSKFEYLDFHRESFYAAGDFVNHQVNIHVPLLAYNEGSALRYVPMSHLIEDDEFILETIPETETGFVRGSREHLSGLMYRPKKIVSGCDIGAAVPIPIGVGEAAIFTSKLIHGGGANHTQGTRVSVDFAVIPSAHVQSQHNFQLAAHYQDTRQGEKYVPIRKKIDSSDL